MSEAKIRSPHNATFVDLWYRIRGEMVEDSWGHKIPAKIDFPLRELAPLMPQIALLHEAEDKISRYILVGTGLVSDFGADFTGTSFFDSMKPETAASLIADVTDYYEEHGHGSAFGRWSSSTAHSTSGRILQYESLTLPYVEPNDGSIRYMMHAHALGTLDFGEGLEPQIEENEARLIPIGEPRPDWLRATA